MFESGVCLCDTVCEALRSVLRKDTFLIHCTVHTLFAISIFSNSIFIAVEFCVNIFEFLASGRDGITAQKPH